MKVTSRMNGKSIFLPAAGGFCTMDYIGANYTGEGIYGYYWTRSLLQNACYAASYLLFYQGGYNASISNYRYMGCSVRPVRRIESEPEPEPQNKESVDLGLPTGTLWATCNVGANSPEEFGSYFAWGETTPKEKYDWVSYKYGNKALWVDDWRVIKYCTNANEGDVDNKTELDPEDDAATANWGSEWQTPSLEQITELLDSRYTTITDATVNTVSGLKVTSIANGRSIFFPYCGWMVDTFLDGAEQNAGVYWSRSLDTIYSHDVWILSIHDGSKDDNAVILRSAGCAVRPVRKK